MRDVLDLRHISLVSSGVGDGEVDPEYVCPVCLVRAHASQNTWLSPPPCSSRTVYITTKASKTPSAWCAHMHSGNTQLPVHVISFHTVHPHPELENTVCIVFPYPCVLHDSRCYFQSAPEPTSCLSFPAYIMGSQPTSVSVGFCAHVCSLRD